MSVCDACCDLCATVTNKYCEKIEREREREEREREKKKKTTIKKTEAHDHAVEVDDVVCLSC